MTTPAPLDAFFRSSYRLERIPEPERPAFVSEINNMLAWEGSEIEDLPPTHQRDLSVKFKWGHDHYFSPDLNLKGHMGSRHTSLIKSLPHTSLNKILGYRRPTILDIGPWTGGISLTYAMLGARVTAVEEVVKYAHCTDVLARAFNANITTHAASLYSLNNTVGYYDIVSMLGVLYHLSDPIVALRIAFNMLRPGGTLILESAVEGENNLTYHGSGVSGWNWFMMGPGVISDMLEDVGYADPYWLYDNKDGRCMCTARKNAHKTMTQSGLSYRMR